MNDQIGWRGNAEKGESHLTLTVADDALVQAAWKQAEAARPAFDAMMREIRDRTNGQGSQLPGDRLSEGVAEVDYSLKTLESLRGKVARELRKDLEATTSEILADMKDLNRYTLLFEAESYTHGVQESFNELRARGFDEIKVQNTWTDPVYKGINSAWEHRETGQRIELQLHTPDSFDVKMANHKLFELARSGALVEEFGREKAGPYIDAANQLMNERYQTCREVNGEKLPIVEPANHEQLAKPFARVELQGIAEEKHFAAVRERAGEPAPAVVPNQSTQQNMSVAQLAELKGGVKNTQTQSAASTQSGTQAAGQAVNPIAGAARQRSVRGNAQSTGNTAAQGPAAQQNAVRPRQLPQQNNNPGRGRGQ
ncbi:hypothetical protein C3486_11975 [Streptomyces sp. Ru73]|uniref:hypothetical protein n=1 Tax=Streptomyces sp. Ru73 TaxID=2080748 RepID=UPI000CDE2F80|nr:hypothetical protein [Streptomyces sp. Ru73]POX40899.1 hypothetical protein C3486_11975 [Streptomyces sp. Ru73]